MVSAEIELNSNNLIRSLLKLFNRLDLNDLKETASNISYFLC
jgi:hypothetical protein